MAPFLRGERRASDLAAALGPSASGFERLEYYQELVRRDVHAILRKLFPATRHAAESFRAGLFDHLGAGLVEQYRRLTRASHWDPNHLGAGFSEFLLVREERDGLPPYLHELADYEYTEYAVSVALEPAPGENRLERTLFVRSYEHAVVEHVRAVGRGEKPAPPN